MKNLIANEFYKLQRELEDLQRKAKSIDKQTQDLIYHLKRLEEELKRKLK